MSQRRRATIYWFLLLTGMLTFAVTFAAIVFNIYIRWHVNQDFSFFGGYDAVALGIMLLGQMLALAYVYHSERS